MWCLSEFRTQNINNRNPWNIVLNAVERKIFAAFRKTAIIIADNCNEIRMSVVSLFNTQHIKHTGTENNISSKCKCLNICNYFYMHSNVWVNSRNWIPILSLNCVHCVCTINYKLCKLHNRERFFFFFLCVIFAFHSNAYTKLMFVTIHCLPGRRHQKPLLVFQIKCSVES